MDKYEFSMKVDELKRLAANEQFRKAYKVLETIDINKIKNIKELYVIVDILLENEKYENAKEILIGISKKIKSRRVYHQLIDISIKSGQVDSAKKYMKEFRKIAPKDPYNYVFLYQIAQLLEESMEQQIRILEDLKQYEYMEKWAYELAKAYHRGGRDGDCIAECNDLILWFGDGIYVEKAKLLKQYLTGGIGQDEIKNFAKAKDSFGARKDIRDKKLENKKLVIKETFASSSLEGDRGPGQNEDENQSELAQLSRVWSQKETKKVTHTETDPKTIDGGKASYQSAFDLIEDMERKEQEEELDRIIEAAKSRKQKEASSLENDISSDEQEPQGEEVHALDNEVEESTEAPEEKIDDTRVATEKQVKALVNETANSIAEQIGAIFDEVNESAVAIEKPCTEEETIAEEEVNIEEEAIAKEQEVTDVETIIEEEVSTEEAIVEEEVRTEEDTIVIEQQQAVEEKFQKFLQSKLQKEIDVYEHLGQFAKIQRICEDMQNSLENILDAHNNITFLLQGSNTFYQTYFARRFAKLLYELEVLRSRKIIILSEEKFLQVDFTKHAKQAEDSCVVVEQVTVVTEQIRNQVESLHQLGCSVILEVHFSESDTLIQSMKELLSFETIYLVDPSAIDLLGFAKNYAEEREYQIDQDGLYYLKDYINECLNVNGSMAFCKVLEKIANAYHCANQRNKVELRNIAELGNYEDAAFMSIRYTDFANEN